MRRVCVIGAGSSGIAACQALHGRGIPFDCFEAGSSVGGNWRYGNDNGMSAAYGSLRAKSSRRGMQYAAFPMPAGYPDYPGHEMIARYLDDVADHFGLRGRIRFRTEVTRVEPAPGGGWDVTARSRDTGAERTGRGRRQHQRAHAQAGAAGQTGTRAPGEAGWFRHPCHYQEPAHIPARPAPATIPRSQPAAVPGAGL